MGQTGTTRIGPSQYHSWQGHSGKTNDQRTQQKSHKSKQLQDITKGSEAIHGEENTMLHLPRQINDGAIQRHDKELCPGRRPVQLSKGRSELPNTMRSHMREPQQSGVGILTGSSRHWDHSPRETTDSEHTRRISRTTNSA